MPVVPFVPNRPQGNIAPQIDPTFLMMATADLHQSGLLFEDRAKPAQDAIASGDFDPVGKNSTEFKGKGK